MSFERPWLAQLSGRRAGRRSTSTNSRPSSSVLESALDKYRDRPAFANLGRVLTYAEVDRLSAPVRRLPAQRAQAQEGRPRRDHDAQLPAVPDRDLRRPARRPDGGQHQPDVHRARAQAPAGRLRRQRDRGARQLRAHACRKCSPTPRSSRSSPPASATCSAFPKGAIVNFVLKHVKKMVPGLRHPRRDPLQRRAHARRRRSKLPDVDDRLRTTSPSCSTPAAPPASPRARCSPTATSSPTCSRPRRGSARTCKYGEEIIITALPLYHIFALTGELPGLHEVRRR